MRTECHQLGGSWIGFLHFDHLDVEQKIAEEAGGLFPNNRPFAEFGQGVVKDYPDKFYLYLNSVDHINCVSFVFWIRPIVVLQDA